MRRPLLLRATTFVISVAVALLALSASAGAAAPLTVYSSRTPILAVSAQQIDGTAWVLAGDGSAKTLSKVVVATGAVDVRVSVSPQATSVAQSEAGQLVLGTANGRSSAVVLYNATTAAFIGAVRMPAAVLGVSITPTGNIIYAVVATAPHRTVRAFNVTRRVLYFPVAADALAVAPVPGAATAWVLRSSGSLEKLRFDPTGITSHLTAASAGRPLAVVPAGSALYVLVRRPRGTDALVRYPTNGGTPTVVAAPRGSLDIAHTVVGGKSELLDAIGSRVVIIALPR